MPTSRESRKSDRRWYAVGAGIGDGTVNESQARLPRIVVRGTRDGLVIVLPERGTTRDLVQALAQRIAGAEGFFKGAEVVLDYGTRAVVGDELTILRQVLDERGIMLRTATATGF